MVLAALPSFAQHANRRLIRGDKLVDYSLLAVCSHRPHDLEIVMVTGRRPPNPVRANITDVLRMRRRERD